MNFRQIDCVLQVARDLSFSKAAKDLYVSQSVVSQNVSALESELSTRLFLRNRRSVSLTPAGEFFCSRMPEIRREFDESVQKTRDIGQGSGAELSIGYDGPMAETWFGRALGLLCAMHPDLNIHIRKECVSYLTNLLIDGSIDLAITHNFETDGVKAVSFHPLLRSGCCAFLPTKHSLAKRERVTLEDLHDEVILVDCRVDTDRFPTRTAEVLKRAGLSFERARYVVNGDAIFSMVEAGMGVFVGGTFCEGYSSRYDISCVPVSADIPDVFLGLAWRTGEKPACADMFASCAKRAFVL